MSDIINDVDSYSPPSRSIPPVGVTPVYFCPQDRPCGRGGTEYRQELHGPRGRRHRGWVRQGPGGLDQQKLPRYVHISRF